ncbi:transcription initiation factor IID, 31kD subunit-domain-containing protein [Calycina marina]|uniref:Transcription initiation factor IID, 31kD subunit-domain-containing protein n=1 Tax=Calycina marina TaxID=1763456 RepID=A0A9P7Z505_9HELO|nr:transcription initiation factor IID, 31kD subunit-domain-containing protein [Calycina marina]
MADVNGDSAASQTNGRTSATPAPQAAPAPIHSPNVPLTSLQDSGHSRRPRDARLIHMLLTSLNVTAYQERVPLQLLDFAYRHSSSILSDALHLSSDAYTSQQSRAREQPPKELKDPDGQVSPQAVQLAISSRLQYQFSGGNGLSKEFLLETAQARNKIALPRVLQHEWGVRLPSERFVLSGVPWGLKEEWRTADGSDGEEDGMQGLEGLDSGGLEGMENEEEGNEEGGNMEDIFGVGPEGNDEDTMME